MQVNGIGNNPAAAPAEAEKAQSGSSRDSEIQSLEQQIEQENRELEKDQKELFDAVAKQDNNKSELIRGRIQQRQMTVQTLLSQVDAIRAEAEKDSQPSREIRTRHQYDRVELDERMTGQKLEALVAAGRLVGLAPLEEEEQ